MNDNNLNNDEPSEQNPQYLYSLTHPALLSQIVNGTIDSRKLAEEELKKRGLDKDGKWIGFDRGR
jgi:hypothetical protein